MKGFLAIVLVATWSRMILVGGKGCGPTASDIDSI